MEIFTTRPELCGIFGGVASTHWIASAVGMRMLEAGGNAFDAAAAAGFTLQIVEPHLNGPGGDAPILVSRANDLAPTVICGQGPAPASASIERFQALGLDLIPGTGLLAACVPGAFGAWLTMLRDYGTATLRDILEPAIFYAEKGHPILARAVDAIASVKDLFVDEWTTSASAYLENGSPPSPESLFANPALATFYRQLVEHAEGVASNREAQIEAALAYWYEGPVAEEIERFCRETEALDVSGRRHQGLLTADDLAGWRPPIERPLHVDQGNLTLFKCGAWSQGPSLLQALRILEGSEIAALSPESPDYVHLVTETMKLVFADRDAWYGDTPHVPIETLLSRDYGARRRQLISASASLTLQPGDIDGRNARLPVLLFDDKVDQGSGGGEPTMARLVAGGGEPTMARLIAGGGEPAMAGPQASSTGYQSPAQKGDTCHIAVVDRWGNMVSATPSGGWLQSSPMIPKLGFALGTRMQMFWLEAGLANSLAPGKRPRTTLTPSMAFKDGKPYLAFGTPGGDQQEQWSLQFWLAHVVHGRPLQRAIDTAAFHTKHAISSFWPRDLALGSLTLEDRFPAATIEALKTKGHAITVADGWSDGRLAACSYERVGQTALIRAASNPRAMQGYAVAR